MADHELGADRSVPRGYLSPPAPLVRFGRHPLRWVRNKFVLTLDALVLAHVGVLVMAALYYLITQTDHSVKHWWDTTVTPASLRHDIRDVGEGILAACLAQAVVWNPFTRGHQSTGRVFREWKRRYHLPVGIWAVLSASALGAVTFAIGDVLLHLLSVRSSSHTLAGSLWNRTTTLWRSDWNKKALGFVSAVAARKPLHVLFDQAQAYFAGRRAMAGRPLRWYHPPVFRARYNYLVDNSHEVRRYPVLLTYFMGLVVVAVIGLAGFGYYVLTYKA
ncbi:MAG TPA: hypothetical protein VFH70_03970 [Acidimicrobiales bacterium]|nr:hypothetical protein [Acidimicrobiales bacterium]